MSKGILGIAVAAGEVREVPKLAMNMEELCFCFGSTQLVNDLRGIEALKPVKKVGRVLLFDVDEVRVVWERFKAGHFDGMLNTRTGGFAG